MTEEKQKTESNASPTIRPEDVRVTVPGLGVLPSVDGVIASVRIGGLYPENRRLVSELGVLAAEPSNTVTISAVEISVVNARANVETALVATACPNPGEIAMCIETLIRAVLAERLSRGPS